LLLSQLEYLHVKKILTYYDRFARSGNPHLYWAIDPRTGNYGRMASARLAVTS
jgi:hypothetical protein